MRTFLFTTAGYMCRRAEGNDKFGEHVFRPHLSTYSRFFTLQECLDVSGARSEASTALLFVMESPQPLQKL